MPSPSKKTEPTVVSFPAAVQAMMDGFTVTKLEWNNPKIYGYLNNGHLQLRKDDGRSHDWIISDGDLFGTDWVIRQFE